MKLRNKKTGKIYVADKEPVELFYRLDEGDELIRKSYVSISELNEEWEDYKPKEPVIKDEKNRKAEPKVGDIIGVIRHGGEYKPTYYLDEICGEEEE